MGELVTTQDGLMFSLTALAREFEVSRETLRKKLDSARVQSCGKGRNGYPLFRVRDVHNSLSPLGMDDFDPDGLEPFARKAFYQAEHEKLRLETERGELLSRIHVEQEYARFFEVVGRFLDTLPDNLERDGWLTPPQVQRVESLIDRLRDELYREVIDGADGAVDVAG